MSDLRIADAPELEESEVQGGLKIPTGGFGNKAINMNTVAGWVVKEKDLPNKGYIDNAIAQGNQGLSGHVNNKNNPHEVTKTQIGLGNVDNTADVDKPISNAVNATLNTKADKSTTYTKTEVYNKIEIDHLEKPSELSIARSGENQQEINDYIGANWYAKVGGYNVGDRVRLSDGTIVKSTVSANLNNPNVNMLGWDTTTGVIDQKSVRSLSTTLAASLTKYNTVDLDQNETTATPVRPTSDQKITSNGYKLEQTTQRTTTVETVFGASNVIVDGLTLKQDKTAPIEGGRDDDNAMFTVHGGKNNQAVNNILDGQYGVSFSYGSVNAATRSSLGNLAAFNVGLDIQGMFIENIGAKYTRIIGNFLDSETKGTYHGIRLAGFDTTNTPTEILAPCHGVVASANVFRNITNGVSAQNSSKFANLSAMHMNNVDHAIHSTEATSLGNTASLHRFDFTANEVKQKVIFNRNLNHSKFGFAADCSDNASYAIEETSGYTGLGFNYYEGILRNSPSNATLFRYSHNLYDLQIDAAGAGTAATISGQYGSGNITVNNAANGVLIPANFSNLNVTATNCSSYGFGSSGSYNNINLQTDSPVTISGSGNTLNGRAGGKVTVSGKSNNLNLTLSSADVDPIDITSASSFNNVKVVILGRAVGKYARISSNNNIVSITDNSEETTDTAVSVTGSNNIVTVNTKGRVLVSGSNNTIICDVARITTSGNNNVVIGQALNVSNTGTGNNYNALKGGTAKSVVTLTTDSLGQITLAHGLITTAASVNVSVINSSILLFATVANVAPNASTSKIQIWNADGTKATAGLSVSLSFNASV